MSNAAQKMPIAMARCFIWTRGDSRVFPDMEKRGYRRMSQTLVALSMSQRQR
jgi:hypothetical protein